MGYCTYFCNLENKTAIGFDKFDPRNYSIEELDPNNDAYKMIIKWNNTNSDYFIYCDYMDYEYEKVKDCKIIDSLNISEIGSTIGCQYAK